MDNLKKLQLEAASRGDDCLSLLLAGINFYVQAGRELELLESMRSNAEEMREAIENTPSAQDLRRLFEQSE